MGQREQHGVKGILYLQRDWEESSSTHLEHYNDLYLESAEKATGVVLVFAHGKKNFIKISDSDYVEKRLFISVKDLVDLIRERGKEI